MILHVLNPSAANSLLPILATETIPPRALLVIAGSKGKARFRSEDVMKKAKDPKESKSLTGNSHRLV